MAARTESPQGFNIQDVGIVGTLNPQGLVEQYNPETPKVAQQALADQAKQAEALKAQDLKDKKIITAAVSVILFVVGCALIVASCNLLDKRDALPEEVSQEAEVKQIEGELQQAEGNLKVSQQHLKWSQDQLAHLEAGGTDPYGVTASEYRANLVRYGAEVEGYQAKIDALKTELDVIENGPQPMNEATQAKIKELRTKLDKAWTEATLDQQHIKWSEGQLEHLEANSQASGTKGSSEYNRIHDQYSKNVRRYTAERNGYINQINGYADQILTLQGAPSYVTLRNQAIRADYKALTDQATGFAIGGLAFLGGALVGCSLKNK